MKKVVLNGPLFFSFAKNFFNSVPALSKPKLILKKNSELFEFFN